MAGSALSKSGMALWPISYFETERLQIYMRLVGEDAMANTTFVTTDWPHESEEKYDDAVYREQQLRMDSNYLAPFIRQGAMLTRFLGDRASAEAVMTIARRETRTPLQIQRELVDQSLGLQVTQAGKLVATSVEDMLEFYSLTIAELQIGRISQKSNVVIYI